LSRGKKPGTLVFVSMICMVIQRRMGLWMM
jgi:hypothetical protein